MFSNIRDIFYLRSELKQRTDKIIKSIRFLGNALNRNTSILKKLIDKQMLDDSTKSQLKKSLESLIMQESQLIEAIKEHLEIMKEIRDKI
jgi:DNA-binding ferritin-like protein